MAVEVVTMDRAAVLLHTLWQVHTSYFT